MIALQIEITGLCAYTFALLQMQTAHAGGSRAATITTTVLVISISANIYIASYIAFKIIQLRRALNSAQIQSQHDSQYASIITMFIESAALYTAITISFFVICLTNPEYWDALALAWGCTPVCIYVHCLLGTRFTVCFHARRRLLL
jgi:hypothetical protein